MSKPYFRNPGPDGTQRPIAFSHRGFSPDGHENTLAAFQAAIGLGFAFLEMDVRSSRDGVVMVFHDERLERVTDGYGPISSRTFAELQQLRVRGSEPIPTLEDVMTRWPEAKLNIDIKDEASVKPFAELVERYQAHDRVLVACFSDLRRLRVLRRLSRPTAASAGMAVNGLIKLLAPLRLTGLISRLAKVDCVQIPLTFHNIPVLTDGFVRRCRDSGLPVHVWTINHAGTMDRLLDLGVDGVMTDHANLLADAMWERGAWPQVAIGGGRDAFGRAEFDAAEPARADR